MTESFRNVNHDTTPEFYDVPIGWVFIGISHEFDFPGFAMEADMITGHDLVAGMVVERHQATLGLHRAEARCAERKLRPTLASGR